MSLKLYTDRAEVFECNVALKGASLKNSSIRAVLKLADKSLLYEGKIASSGKSEIIFPKLKNILEEGDAGTMVLEVIADDAYFQPYKEKFTVQTSKKAVVEIITSKPVEPQITVKKVTPESQLIELLVARGVTRRLVIENKTRFSKVFHSYYQENKFKIGYKKFLNNILSKI
jgi:hypothetical protein|tara:strand:+ start:157 stop:672 length:516 start_codon:yes stop_codon:yes gene_type:complete